MKYCLSLTSLICLFVLVSGCAPVTVTRIGPPVKPKKEDCPIALLEDGKTPDRPYRDVGVLVLKNCPDYHLEGCRKWVFREACKLGGDLVYDPVDSASAVNAEHPIAGIVSWRFTVAAYVGSLPPEKDDPVLNSKPAAPCSEGDATNGEAEDPEDQMCRE